MVASETRLNARKALEGKWGKAALVTLVYALIMFVGEWLLNLIPVVGPIAVTVLSVPLGYGLVVTFMDLRRGKEVSVVQFLTEGFASFSKVWMVTLWTIVKMIIPVIVMIVAIIMMVAGGGMALYGASAGSSASSGGVIGVLGILLLLVASVWMVIRYYLYALNFYIIKDNPDMAAKDVVNKSSDLMNGNRMKLFCLQLSFIGWAILASFTFGIGYLWLMPYISVASVVFYEVLAGVSGSSEPAEEAKPEEEEEVIKEND